MQILNRVDGYLSIFVIYYTTNTILSEVYNLYGKDKMDFKYRLFTLKHDIKIYDDNSRIIRSEPPCNPYAFRLAILAREQIADTFNYPTPKQLCFTLAAGE